MTHMKSPLKACRKAVEDYRPVVGRGLRSALRNWVREIARRYDPDRIVLFGSHARGRANADSDVDILVVLPTKNEIRESVRLSLALDPPFPLDLIVRTPDHLRRGLEEGDPFLREVIAHGKVLHEKNHRALARKAEADAAGARSLAAIKPVLNDLVCFHCQQAAEKYLKALLLELGLPPPRTHNLQQLLTLLLPHVATLKSLRRSLVTLSRFAVEYRYPGQNATGREARSALLQLAKVRSEIRRQLGLSP